MSSVKAASLRSHDTAFNDPFSDFSGPPPPTPPSRVGENNPYRRSHHRSSSSSVRPTHPRPAQRRRSHSDQNAHSPPQKNKNQSTHRRKISTIPGPDTIDRLGDTSGGLYAYHHEGPFDATLRARQIPGYSPVEALRESNEKALAATPRANIIDSLEKHYPLQGTAMIPPGVAGMEDYEEYDVMRKDGGYKRWAHMEYKDEDLKGKGEPSYTIEEFEKQQKAARKRGRPAKRDEYEMNSAGIGAGAGANTYRFKREGGLGRSTSSAEESSGFRNKLKTTFESLRKRS